MEVPGLGVKLELQLRPMPQPQQCYILATFATYATVCGNTGNPLSEAMDWTHIFMNTSWVLNSLSYNRNSPSWPVWSVQVGGFKSIQSGVPWWHSRLRIQHCHCNVLGHCSGTGSVLGPGTSTSHVCSQKKKRRRRNMGKNKEHSHCCSTILAIHLQNFSASFFFFFFFLSF